MRQPRPIARDGLDGRAAPITVAKRVGGERASASRSLVTHSYAAVAFYTGGRARMQLNGEWNLAEGDALIVPAGSPHRSLETRAPELWCMSFCTPCYAAEDTASLLAPIERVRDGASAVVHVPPARHEYLGGLFRELASLGHARSETFDAVQRSLLTLILAELDKASSPSDLRGAAGGSVVVDALRFIEKNCLRHLGLADVAAAVRRSPAYVTTALTRATGRSAVQWIVSGRMAEARRLLLHSDEKIDVIAGRVGYADPTHFIRMFRREHGATPSAWRTAHALDR